MIMTRQEINVKEYFIGSHAQEIINRSDLPVISTTPLVDEGDAISSELISALVDPINIFKI